MPLVTVQNARFNVMQLGYKGVGEAEDLIMVHGLAANMAFWLQHYGQAFSRRFRVTLFDMRGHGRSDITASGYTPDALAGDLKALINELGLKKPNVIAHSFGGVVTMNLACRDPELFSSIILNDTHVCEGRERARTANWQSGEAIEQALASCGLKLDTRDPYFGYHLITAVARIRAAGQEVPEAIMPWVKWILNANNKVAAERWLQLMETTNAQEELTAYDNITTEKLTQINAPILAMYGEKSQAMATGEYLKATLPHITFITIPNSGHFFPKAQPELVTNNCEKFWSSLTSPREAVA